MNDNSIKLEDIIFDKEIFVDDKDKTLKLFENDWRLYCTDRIELNSHGVKKLIKKIINLRKFIYYWSQSVEVGCLNKNLLKSIERNKCLSEIAKSFEQLKLISKLNEDIKVKKYALLALFSLKPESLDFTLNLVDNINLFEDNKSKLTKYLLDYAVSLKKDFDAKLGLKLVWKRKLIQIGSFRCSGASYFDIELQKKRICIGGCVLDLAFHNYQNYAYDAIYILPDITAQNFNTQFAQDLIVKTYGLFEKGVTIDLFCASETISYLSSLKDKRDFYDFIAFESIKNQIEKIKTNLNIDIRIFFLTGFINIDQRFHKHDYWAVVSGALINTYKSKNLVDLFYGYNSTEEILIPEIKIQKNYLDNCLIHPREAHLKLNHHENQLKLN